MWLWLKQGGNVHLAELLTTISFVSVRRASSSSAGKWQKSPHQKQLATAQRYSENAVKWHQHGTFMRKQDDPTPIYAKHAEHVENFEDVEDEDEGAKPKKKEKRSKRHRDYSKCSMQGRLYRYRWQAISSSEFMDDENSDELPGISTERLPGGPTEVENALFSANVPFRFRSEEFKRREHERLMATVQKEIEVVAAEQAKNRWQRDPPDKLRRWQRDYIQQQLYKERKKQQKEIEKLENMQIVEKRLARRMQGLPESEDEEEPLPWHSPEIIKWMKKGKRKQIQPPPYNSLWVKRPRDLTTLYIDSTPQNNEEECEQENVEVEKPPVKPIKTEKELREREKRRFERFQRYVEKRVPRFENHEEEGEEEEEEEEEEEDGQESTRNQECLQTEFALQLQKPTFEIPPLVPGRGSVLVASLYEILKDGEWDAEKVAVLHKFRYAKLLPYQVCEVLKRLKNWRVALEFFNWCKTIPFFKHDTLNYSTVIKALGTCGNYVEGRKLFDEMRSKGIPMDIYTVNNMIKCYGSANRIDEAMDMYREIESYGCKADICTYAVLIDLLGKAGRNTEMRQLFLDLQSSNLKADSYVFNSMIANFSKWKDVRLAVEASEHMKMCGVQFSTVTYAILLHMYAKSMSFFKAEKLYHEYLESHLAPDLYVYNNAVLFLGLAGRCKEAEWAMEDIEKAGLIPDKFSYCTIISAWARQGCCREARKWFNKARSRGITPSAEMCNALIDAYIKALNLEPIGDILDSMPGWGVKPTLQTYTYLFNYYSECSKGYVDVLREYMRKTEHPANKFLEEVFGGKVPLQKLKEFSQEFFESVRLEKSGWARKFADAVIHYLQTYGYIQEAHAVFEAAAATRLFKRNLWDNLNDNWHIWLVDMEEGTALIGLTQGLLISRNMLKKSFPAAATIVTGYNRHKDTRTALAVRNALKELESPFRTHLEYARMVSKGDMFAEWLQGTPIEIDIDFKHPGYVYPAGTRVCFRLMNA